MAMRSEMREPRPSRWRRIAWVSPILWVATLGLGASGQEPAGLPFPPLVTPSPAPPPAIGGLATRKPAVAATPEVSPDASLVRDASKTSTLIEVKVGQGRFITLKEDLAVAGQQAPILAVGDPNVTDFFQVGPRQLRLIGKRLGTTDLSITTGAGRTYDYEVQVVADLDDLRAQLRQLFPDASLRLAQFREKVVVEGQARDAGQVRQIISMIDGYVRSTQVINVAGSVGNVNNEVRGDPNAPPGPPQPAGAAGAPANAGGVPGVAALPTGTPVGFSPVLGSGAAAGPTPVSPGAIATNQIATGQFQVVNLIRVPTSQQVMLKVRVAEMNRTAFRQIGADFLAEIPQFGTLFGTQIAGNGFNGTLGPGAFTRAANGKVTGGASLGLGSQATFFGTFSNGNFNTVLTALRRNNILKVLAEPNLIALNGYQANFLAGGEFPVPSFSGVGSGSGVGGTSSTQFKQFGVRLSFLPIVLDNDTIRLTVDPEVSTVDFSVATTLVPGGSPVPGLNKRSSHTTVELKQGETLAIAGLLQLTLDGQTQRIPGLGDLPFIGEFFSNTTGNRIEKELVVTVTPYIVEPMAPGQVPAGPGDEVNEPNDLEFFFLNRIEGRTGIDKRSTTSYDDPFHLIRHSIVERKYLIGPSGYSQ